METNYGTILGILVLCIISGIWLWNIPKFCINSAKDATPPKDIDLAEMGFLIHGGNNVSYDFISLFFYWIERGWIMLQKHGEDMVLFSREAKIDEGMAKYEKDFFYHLFPEEDSIHYHIELKEILSAILPYYVKQANQYHKTQYRISTKYHTFLNFIAFLFSVAPIFIAVIQMGNMYYESLDIIDMCVVSLLLLLIPAMVGLFVHLHSTKTLLWNKQIYPILFLYIALIIGSISMYTSLRGFIWEIYIQNILLPFLCSSLNMILLASMLPFSLKFSRNRKRVYKFKKALKKTKNERIDTQHEDTFSYAKHLLPYVMALGILPAWDFRFSLFLKGDYLGNHGGTEQIDISILQMTLEMVHEFTEYIV